MNILLLGPYLHILFLFYLDLSKIWIILRVNLSHILTKFQNKNFRETDACLSLTETLTDAYYIKVE